MPLLSLAPWVVLSSLRVLWLLSWVAGIKFCSGRRRRCETSCPAAAAAPVAARCSTNNRRHCCRVNNNNNSSLSNLQEKSYFALRLPAGWWVFGLDLALVGDIDMCQYRCVCMFV